MHKISPEYGQSSRQIPEPSSHLPTDYVYFSPSEGSSEYRLSGWGLQSWIPFRLSPLDTVVLVTTDSSP